MLITEDFDFSQYPSAINEKSSPPFFINIIQIAVEIWHINKVIDTPLIYPDKIKPPLQGACDDHGVQSMEIKKKTFRPHVEQVSTRCYRQVSDDSQINNSHGLQIYSSLKLLLSFKDIRKLD